MERRTDTRDPKACVRVPRAAGDAGGQGSSAGSASVTFDLRGLTALNRTEAVHLKADILAKVRQAFVPSPGEYSEVEIFRETAGQIILRARKATAHDRPVMLMVTVTELRSWE